MRSTLTGAQQCPLPTLTKRPFATHCKKHVSLNRYPINACHGEPEEGPLLWLPIPRGVLLKHHRTVYPFTSLLSNSCHTRPPSVPSLHPRFTLPGAQSDTNVDRVNHLTNQHRFSRRQNYYLNPKSAGKHCSFVCIYLTLETKDQTGILAGRDSF